MSLESDLKEAMMEEEVEDLDDACMSLPANDQKTLLTNERLQRVIGYFQMKSNVESLKATINWNEKTFGTLGKEKSKGYIEQLEKAELDMKHQIRAVKLMDKKLANL